MWRTKQLLTEPNSGKKRLNGIVYITVQKIFSGKVLILLKIGRQIEQNEVLKRLKILRTE